MQGTLSAGARLWGWVALVDNIPAPAPRLNGLSVANAASSQSYDLNSPSARRWTGRGTGGSGTRRRGLRQRQKKYESPQSTPVAAAQPHASGPSSCGRAPVQSVP